MATTTTNLGLKKPAYSEAADVADINDNMDIIDQFAGSANEAIANVEGGIAYIVGNTNTTGVTLAAGQFVYVKGHSTIAEGLRKVTASISANANITTSNTSACSSGGLNELNSNLSGLRFESFSGITLEYNNQQIVTVSRYSINGGNNHIASAKALIVYAPGITLVATTDSSKTNVAFFTHSAATTTVSATLTVIY